MSIHITDGEGNQFKSIAEASRQYGQSTSTVYRRIRRHWNVDTALTKRADISEKEKFEPKECQDHLGNQYKSFSDMCKAYGVNRTTVCARLDAGASLEEALTNPKKQVYIGKMPLRKVCELTHKSVKVVRERLRRGMCIRDAFNYESKHKKPCCDHLGNEFESFESMAKHYGLSRYTLNTRLSIGWPLEKALTQPVRHK